MAQNVQDLNNADKNEYQGRVKFVFDLQRRWVTVAIFDELATFLNSLHQRNANILEGFLWALPQDFSSA